jgi:hypothetical protein
MSKKITTTIFLFVIVLVVSGCVETVEPIVTEVDPTFREFYESLGGESILGPAISIMYEERGKKLQFTTGALMMYNPMAGESERFRLVPLGNAMKIAEPPLSPTSPNGHEVYPGFLPLFRRLGGTRVTGKPITSVKADPENQRILQYFENVGFYQLESDNPDTAHLLYYGVWKCAQACSFPTSQENLVLPPTSPGLSIQGAIDRLDPGLTGFPLSDIIIAPDGKEEQIFENVVIFTDPESPAGIALRPLPYYLEIRPDPPTQAGQDKGKFIAVNGNLGYNVPEHIDDYIERNNGYDFIGKPINHYDQINNDLYRQCFENLCLDYRPNNVPELQIRPMPLGRRYKQQFTNEESSEVNSNSFDAVTLTVWERYPVINTTDIQEIYVMVLDNGNPLRNVDLELKFTMPDGSSQTKFFPPTDQSGQAYLEISPIGTSDGTLIVYQVCLANTPQSSDCVMDDYLIWGK